MRKLLFLLLVLTNTTVQSLGQAPHSTNDTSLKKSPPAKDRNMFGLNIPRGLKINSEGLAPGYIIFVVPNSPYVYLINRRGEVVHQWKGNYAVLGAYLQDD